MTSRSEAPQLDLSRQPVLARMMKEARAGVGVAGFVRTGLPVFDTWVPQVMRRRTMMIILGLGGAGKSAMARQVVRCSMGEGARVVVLATDKGGGDQWARDIAADDGIGGDVVVVVTHVRLTYPKLTIVDDRTIEATVREFVTGDGPVLFVVDGLASSRCESTRGDDELAHALGTSRAIDRAKELGACVLVTAEGRNGSTKYLGTIPGDVIIQLEYNTGSHLTHWRAHKPTYPPRSGWFLIRYGQPVEVAEAPVEATKQKSPKATKAAKRRRADNPPARSPAEIEADARAYITDNQGCKIGAVVRTVSGRDSTVTKIIHEHIIGNGVVVRDGGLFDE